MCSYCQYMLLFLVLAVNSARSQIFTDLHTLTLAARSSCTLGRGEATCTCLYYNTRIQHITIHSYMYLCVLCITIHRFSTLQLPKAVTKTLHMSGIFVALLLISSCYDKWELYKCTIKCHAPKFHGEKFQNSWKFFTSKVFAIIQ